MTFELTLINQLQPHDVKYDRNKVAVVMLNFMKLSLCNSEAIQLEMPIFLNDGQHMIHYVHTKVCPILGRTFNVFVFC